VKDSSRSHSDQRPRSRSSHPKASAAGQDRPGIPVYPLPEAAANDSAPGTVFTTESDEGPAIWIVLERRDDGMSYARVAPGRIAGTITVACRPDTSPDETRVTARYDVTSSAPDDAAFVEELEAGYDAFLDEWRREILGALAD
jgi:hypothetical protein